MRILFIGDYSNLHATLGMEMRRRGHEVTIISDRGIYMNSYADIYLNREKGLFGGFRYLFDLFSLLPKLKDYDVVQLVNSNFLSLKPGKIKYFFDRIKDQNGKTFLTLASDDYYFCKACLDGKLFRFSDFKVGNQFTEYHLSNPSNLYGWTSYSNRHWHEYLYNRIDGAMSVLPEYDMVAREIIPEKTAFTNLPIDLSSLPQPSYDIESPVKLFLGVRAGKEIQKGYNKLIKIAREVETELPGKAVVETVSNLSLKEFLQKMNTSNIVLDQLYAYSPATSALFAMAMGKVAGSGAQPEYYEYLGNPSVRPVLSLSPFDTDIKERLIHLIENPDEIRRLGMESRKLVEKHNDVKIVADKFLRKWSEH